MRATTVLRRLTRLNEQKTVVTSFRLDGTTLHLDVRPNSKRHHCGGCGRRARRQYDRRERSWRHTDLGETQVQLHCVIWRVECPRCGVKTEMVPWADPNSRFTYDFEQLVAYTAQGTDFTRVSKQMRITWPTVGAIVKRVMHRLGDRHLLDGLTSIGIDELSYRKHHSYVTVVVDHLRRRVVWVAPGKSAETVAKFFQALGPERTRKLTHVSIDMSAAFRSAVEKAAPHATIVFDRFHVQRLAHDAVDQVRRELAHTLGTEEARSLKNTRFALQRSIENRTEMDTRRIADVMFDHAPLFRAWCLKEALVAILDLKSVHTAKRRLREWIAWAARSQLRAFVRVGRTIREHLAGILAYVESGLSNGRHEGINGKIRVLTRRAFGFRHVASLISLMFLCCSGLSLTPRHETHAHEKSR